MTTVQIDITIPLPPGTPLAVADRVFEAVREFVAELNDSDDVAATWAMRVGPLTPDGRTISPAVIASLGIVAVTGAPSAVLPIIPAAPSPNGHAPQPEPPPALQKSSKGNRYNLPTDELRGRVLAELQRLALNGVAPSMARWDEDKDQRLPTSAAVTHRLKMKWGALCALAGLESRDNAYKNSLKGQGIGVRVAALPDDDDEEDAGGDDAGF